MKDVSVASGYRMECENCDWRASAKSAGEAEELATEHLESEDAPYFYHSVRIFEYKLVSRD